MASINPHYQNSRK